MGVTISKTAATSSLSLASTIIGLISFAFTVMTWFGIFWSDFRTMSAAPSEIPDFLGNLKQGLYEERAHLRRMHKRLRRRGSSSSRPKALTEKDRRQGRFRDDSSEDALSNKVMRDTIRHMIRTFRALERPFLKDDDPRSGHQHRSTRDDKGWDTEGYGYGYGADEEEDLDYGRPAYRNCGIRERFIWLKTRNSVLSLSSGLARLETRRIAKDIGEMTILFKDLDRRVESLEQRLSRVVGVRRID